MSDALEEIKRLYYATTRATISRDFDRAIDLLKSLPTEEDRERATVYMQGLADMKAEWSASAKFGVRCAESAVPTAESGVRRARSKARRQR